MRFNFSVKRRQKADARFTHVNVNLPDTGGDLYLALLSGPFTGSPDQAPAADLAAVRREIGFADKALVAKLAVHFAEVGNFRDLAFLLTAELAAVSDRDEETGLLVSRVVRQALDIPLWLEHYARATKPGQKPGRAVGRQLGLLFNQLDEYQYSRSAGQSREALRHALWLLRPKAADRHKKNLFARILRDQFPVRSTWEQEWHALYQQHYDSHEQRQVTLRDKWKEGISSFRIGYTALLDNLGPMLCAGVSGKVLKLAAEYLGNAAAVRRSGVTPLRLLEVYRLLRRIDLGGAGMLCEALERAVLHSSWSQSGFGSEGLSVIAMDVSNSMKRPVLGAVGAQRFDVAPLLALMWKNQGYRLITGIIGNTWRVQELPGRSTLLATDEFRAHEGEAGYATHAWLVLQDLLRKKQAVDRILIFTDNRLWDNREFNQSSGTDLGHWWRQYRSQIAPQAKLYLFDLAGYGAKPIQCLAEGVVLVAGWPDRIFDILQAMETGY
jgi:60 kDa SS-A/Ro ribonucleoprotein